MRNPFLAELGVYISVGMKSDCDGKVMAVGAVRFQVARDCSGETEPGFDVIEASLPWLVGGSTTWKPINRAYQRAAEGRDSLSHWQLFTVTARTKYIGQRGGTLLVELVICVEAIKSVAAMATQCAAVTLRVIVMIGVRRANHFSGKMPAPNPSDLFRSVSGGCGVCGGNARGGGLALGASWRRCSLRGGRERSCGFAAGCALGG